MTNEQEKYYEYACKVFSDHRRDITSTIIWINLHYQRMPPDVQLAYRKLTSEQRNEVVIAVCKSENTKRQVDYFDTFHYPKVTGR